MYKPKVLIVEDDPAISNLIRTTLDTQNYQYHTAKNGSSAILDAVSYNPDVIILDLGLPDMDGVDIIKKFAAGVTCRSSSSARAVRIRIRWMHWMPALMIISPNRSA